MNLRLSRKLLIIGGPTAVGKSEVACCVAEKIGGEIISADSMAVYKGMDIGTAKLKECIEKIKHYAVDVAEPDEYFDVKMFEEIAKRAYREIVSKGKIPMLVGGTYLYIQAFLYGIEETPPPDWNLRKKLYDIVNKKGKVYLFNKLKVIDPEYASKIHPEDVRRVVRAIEVFVNTGRPFSSFHKWKEPRYDYVGIYLYRSWESLKRRIEERIRDMIKRGLLEEIKNLLNKGMSFVSLQAIGYKEFIPVVKGEIDLEEGIKKAVKNTCEQAKRQIRWFRKQGWYEINMDIMDSKEACGRIVEIYAKA